MNRPPLAGFQPTADKLLYSANWDAFDKVPFWDALDAIGIVAYFPLSRRPSPSESELAQGWQLWKEKLASVAAREKRPIIFVEANYADNVYGAAEPYAYWRTDPKDRDLQERCLRLLLRLEGERWLAGIFLWEWHPDQPRSGNDPLNLNQPRLQELLRASGLVKDSQIQPRGKVLNRKS